MAGFRISDYVAFQRGGPLRSGERLSGVFVARFDARLFGLILAIDDDFPPADRDVVVDLLVKRATGDYASIFPTPAQTSRIPAGLFQADVQLEDAGVVVDLKRGDRLKPVVVQAGTSASPGNHLTVEAEYSYAR